MPHVSTVPANAGEDAELSLRERVFAPGGQPVLFGERKVVLFIHGASMTTAAAFDLDYEDYSWMEYLARGGYDVFSLDLQGYGLSTRPEMDDACNANPAQQAQLVPNPLPAPCDPSYPFELGTSDSEWDEIDSAVEYIRALRGVDTLNFVSWSLGGVRAGGYAARYPDKVDRLVFMAPLFLGFTPTDPPPGLPRAGYPMTLQSRQDLEELRWNPQVSCEGQVDDAVRDEVWAAAMSVDAVGSTWGPPGGVQRVQTRAFYGWNAEVAAQVEAPTMIIVGENDSLFGAGQAQQAAMINADSVLVNVACGSHFMMWEKQRDVLQDATLEFLRRGSIDDVEQGIFEVDYDGEYTQIE